MNRTAPDLRFIRDFLKVATAENFRAAANAVGKKPSRLRAEIVGFEDKLIRARLFDRRTLRVRSKALVRTEKGDRFLPAARGLSDAVKAAFESVGASSDKAEYLDLRHFDRFVRLTRAGSVAKFAKISRRDPSPIFAELKSFEEEFLQAQLFKRPRRSLKLTIAGQRLFPYAERVAIALANLFECVGQELPTTRYLQIGLASTPSSAFYPKAEIFFRTAHPECVITEIHDSTDNLVAMLRKPDIDLAFVVEPLPPAADLRYEEVYKCTVCCAVSWKHELESLKSITLQQLADRQLVAYSKEAYPQYHLYLEKFFQGNVPEIVAECKDHTQLIRHVARTKHVALVPLQMDKHSENRVRLIPIAPEIRVGVGALSVKRPSRLIRDFVRYAKQCAK